MTSGQDSVERYLKSHVPAFVNGFRHEITRAVWPFHNHCELEIAFLTLGRGAMMFPDGTKLTLEPESFVLIPPYLQHRTRLDLPAETAAVLIRLPGPVPQLLEKVSYVHPHRDHNLTADIMYLTAPPSGMGPLQQIEFDLRSAALLAKLIRLASQPETKLDEGALYVGMAHDYVQRHFAKIRKLDAIAGHVGISYHHLRHLFKKHRGMSLKQFLADLRVNHAKQLLIQSRMLVKEITEECGFENERHFSAYFKKCEGVSPEAYRKCHAKQYTASFDKKPRGVPEKVRPISTTPAECRGIKSRHSNKAARNHK